MASALRSTQKRFNYSGNVWEKDDLPGPGSYREKPGAFDKKSFRQGGATLGETKRFTPIKIVTDAGPGAYHREVNWIHRNGSPTACSGPFGVNSPRETAVTMFPPDPCAPGPSQYNPVKVREPTSPRPVIPKTPRFNQPPNAVPGPGSYNINDSVFRINPKPATQRLWSKFENRLNTWGTGDTPGPGSYNTNWSDFASLPLPPLHHDYSKEYQSHSASPRSQKSPRSPRNGENGGANSAQFVRKSPQVAEYIPGQEAHPPTERKNWPRTTSNTPYNRIKGRTLVHENDAPGVGTYNVSPFRSHSPGGIFPISKRFDQKLDKNPGPGSYQIAKAYSFLDTVGKYPK